MELSKEQKVLQSLLQKAWEDINFRKRLVEDPVNTIETFAMVKIKLPEGKTLIVNDQTDPSKIYINIPEEPSIDNIELGENQLEAIAGGKKFPWETINDFMPSVVDSIKFTF